MDFGYFSPWPGLVEGRIANSEHVSMEIHLAGVRHEDPGVNFTLSRSDLQINRKNHGFEPGWLLNPL